MKTFLLSLVSFLSLSLTQGQTKQGNVTISLFATDLNKCDTLSACDAFVKIKCSSVTSDWHDCGETKVLHDDDFPVWPELFVFPNEPTDYLRWRFDIIDDDSFVNDPIGSLSLNLDEFLTATEIVATHRSAIPEGRGFFFVHRRNQN